MITGIQAFLGVVLLLAVLALYRAQRAQDHPYDIRDVLMDASTGKASLNAHIIAAMAVMAVWVCVDRSNDGKDVDSLVLGVLGIFVVGRLGAQAVSTFKPKEGDETTISTDAAMGIGRPIKPKGGK